MHQTICLFNGLPLLMNPKRRAAAGAGRSSSSRLGNAVDTSFSKAILRGNSVLHRIKESGKMLFEELLHGFIKLEAVLFVMKAVALVFLD
jgi:hypothetical protein